MPPDETIPNPAPVDPPPAASVSQEPSPAPSSVTVAAPVETPASPAPAIVAEPAAAPVVEAPAEPQREPTLIEKFVQERDAKKAGETAPVDPTAAKPADPAKPVDPNAPKIEAKPEDPAKPPVDPAAPAPAAEPAPFDPTVHEFELPATIQGKSPQMDEFRGLLAERDKLPPQEFAQKLVNLHANTMQQFVDSYAKDYGEKQWQFWKDSQQKLTAEVMADPVIGGNNYGGAMEKIAKWRDTFVPEAEMAAFDQELRLSGAGNMVHILKAIYRSQSRFDEPRMPPENPKPPRDIGMKPNAAGRLRNYYQNGT